MTWEKPCTPCSSAGLSLPSRLQSSFLETGPRTAVWEGYAKIPHNQLVDRSSLDLEAVWYKLLWTLGARHQGLKEATGCVWRGEGKARCVACVMVVICHKGPGWTSWRSLGEALRSQIRFQYCIWSAPDLFPRSVLSRVCPRF